MIQNNPIGRLIAHIILIIGILIVAFPIYYTFVASTQSLQEIMRPPLSLLPGSHFWENYSAALFGGVGRIGGVGVDRLLFNTIVMALAIAVGKIVHLYPFGLRNRLLPFSRPHGFLLAHLHYPDATCRSPHPADL